MTQQKGTRKALPGGKEGDKPQLPDNPFAQAISTLLFVGPDEGCNCNFCQMGRQVKGELSKVMLQGGKPWSRPRSQSTE